MDCISDELIQKYIDGEVNKEEDVLIRQHLENCKLCTDRVNIYIKITKTIKSAINSIVVDDFEIGVFEPAKMTVVKPILIRKGFLLTAAMFAAACLVLFIIVFRNGEDIQTEGQMLQTSIYNYEVDANQPLSKQPLIIHVAGPDGHQVDYLIE